MWIFTKYGFLSAVQHRAKPNTLLVRAREPGVLEMLCERGKIKSAVKKTKEADYLYRMEFTKETFAALIAGELLDINYGNFKGAAHAAKSENDRAFHWTLMNVWEEMRLYQDKIEYGDRFSRTADDVLSQEEINFLYGPEVTDFGASKQKVKSKSKGKAKSKAKSKAKAKAKPKKKGKRK